MSFKFFPNLEWEKTAKDKGWAERLTDSLVSSAKGAVKSAANNLTGGLLGSLMNSKVDILDLRKNNSDIGKNTFMEYLAAANLIVGKEDWIGESAGQAVKPLEL